MKYRYVFLGPYYGLISADYGFMGTEHGLLGVDLDLDLKCKQSQGYNAREVNCSGVYSAYILKPVLSGRNL